MKEYSRLGPKEKCPACGRKLDEGAYRCPNCKIYFCFNCRRRINKNEPQYQCLNQQCNYYGKLLCKGCIETQEVKQTPKITHTFPPSKSEQHPYIKYDIMKPLPISLIILGIILGIFFGKNIFWLLFSTAIIIPILNMIMTLFKNDVISPNDFSYIFSADEHNKARGSKVCILCKQPVEILNL